MSPRGTRLRAWFQALRPLAQGNLAPYLILGVAFGVAQRGHFEPSGLLLALVFGVLVHAVVILVNEHGDWQADLASPAGTPFSGGSRVAAEGRLSRGAIGSGALLACGLLLAVSLGLSPLSSPFLPLLAIATIALAAAYAHPPLRLAYRGAGEWLQATGVGLVLPATGYALQAGRLQDLPLLALVPPFLLGLAGNWTTALPDTEADRAAGKRTWPVRLGEGSARRASLLASVAAIALVPLVTPRAHPDRLTIALGMSGALWVLAAALAPGASSSHRSRCLAFVVAQSTVSLALVLGWAWSLAY